MPSDGQGLNPLLQNPWMTIHPPIMFLGYAATAVPFAFAMAALWERRYDEWTKASMPWALVTVVTLGCAILLGGYWAYVTLGWGGYWGWDPVENSSLVPWLASAALVHGMLLQRARGRFRKLNFSLAILAYVLVVYATFLTRSGVLADFSVHSFVDLGITGWLVGEPGGRPPHRLRGAGLALAGDPDPARRRAAPLAGPSSSCSRSPRFWAPPR